MSNTPPVVGGYVFTSLISVPDFKLDDSSGK